MFMRYPSLVDVSFPGLTDGEGPFQPPRMPGPVLQTAPPFRSTMGGVFADSMWEHRPIDAPPQIGMLREGPCECGGDCRGANAGCGASYDACDKCDEHSPSFMSFAASSTGVEAAGYRRHPSKKARDRSEQHQRGASDPPPSDDFGNTCELWKYEGFFCAYVDDDGGGDEDLEPGDVAMLKLAFDMINDNTAALHDFFDRHTSVSSVCPLTRLTGGDGWYPRLMIYEYIGDLKANAATFPGSRYVKFSWQYLRALRNSWNDHDVKGGDDVQACIVLALARTLVHEATHTCYLGEVSGNLIEYYFARRVAKARGLVGTKFCCADKALQGGYDVSDYADADAVRGDPNYQSVTYGTDVDRLSTCA